MNEKRVNTGSVLQRYGSFEGHRRNNFKMSDMKKFWFISVLIFVSVSSCKEEEPRQYAGDYLIFGHFYGECLGESCVRMFKLEDDYLLEDLQDGLKRPYNFETGYRVLPQADFERASVLLDVFPNQLLNEPDTTFGCPDCADQGGLYIEYRRGDTHGIWSIDQDQEEVPTYLHEFTDRVNETIRLINGR